MLIEDKDITLFTKAVSQVAKKTLGNLTSRQTNWTTSITMKFNRLGETITEVHDTMQAKTYGVDPANTLTTPVLLPSLRIEMLEQTFSTEEEKKEVSVHSLDTLILDLSKLNFPQIYSIHHASAIEVRIQENVVSYQAAKATKKAHDHKQVIKRQQKDLEAQAQKQASLE